MTSAHFCPNCGRPVPEVARFCTGCGTSLPEGPVASSSPPSNAQPTAAPSDGTRRRGPVALVVVLVVAVLAAGGVAWLLLSDGDGESAGEVFLEPVGVTVADPFGGNLDVHNAQGAPTTLPRITRAAAVASTTTSAPAAPPETRTVGGGWPGLYGGTRNATTCDRDGLVAFLKANPAKARAWAGVLGLRPQDIESYVAGLTPVLLQRDTRVTNHGFRDGRATPVQSILQAGTAVLVDEFGVPRVKCNCGNPLLEPRALQTRPRYTGTRWPTFSPASVLVVTADVRISVLVLVDVTGGEPIRRPIGTEGEEDAEILVDDLCDLYPDIAGCVEIAATDPPEPGRPGEPDLGTGDVQVTLRWSSTADLDLSVVDPTGSQIDFANRTSPSGGQLDVDSNYDCETATSAGVENVFWPPGAAPDGVYTITVTYFDVCEPSGTGPQAYELTVLVNGSATTLQPAAFRPDGTGGRYEYRIALDDGAVRPVVPLGTAARTESGTVDPGGSISYRAEKGPGFQATSTTTPAPSSTSPATTAPDEPAEPAAPQPPDCSMYEEGTPMRILCEHDPLVDG